MHLDTLPDTAIFLNDVIRLDLTTLIETRLIIQANSGGGKTWAIRRLLEQSHGKVQHIIIDVEGSLRTLRERYEYLLLGSETDQVDYPISPANAAQLSIEILKMRTSVILDLYEFLPSVRQQIVRIILEALINAPKDLWHDCLVIIDEAHIFCPERGSSEAKPAVEALCSRGRTRGFCAVLATQRISKLGKDALGECNNKMLGRASLDIDMKRSNAELEFPAQSQVLKKLAPGEFYVFGPAISPEVQKIRVGQVLTTHPKAGSRRQMSSPPAPASLHAVLASLKALPKISSELTEENTQREERPEQKAHDRRQHRQSRAQSSSSVPHTQAGRQEAVLLAEKDAEIQRLRQQIETLSQITVTLDGKTLPVTALPSVLHLDALQIEQATIEVKQAVAPIPAQLGTGAPAGSRQTVSVTLDELEQRRYDQFKAGLKQLTNGSNRADLAWRILRILTQTQVEMARADVVLALQETDRWIRDSKVETLLVNKRLLSVTRRGNQHAIYYRSLLQERLKALLPARSASELNQLITALFS